MTIPRRHFVNAGALIALGSWGAGIQPARAQSVAYPTKPITLIVPFGAGGPPDAYCRLFARKLESRVGQRVVVDNRPGANSMIGTGYVAKAKPDGYTVLYATNSSLSAAPSLSKSLSYNPTKDFNGITITGEGYFALLIGARDKNATLAQFIERARESPEKYAIGGSSTTAEVLNKQLQNKAKLSHTYIRYAASSQMMTDLMGGRLAAAFQPVIGVAPFLQHDGLQMIAIAAPSRLPAYPQTPIINETVPGVDVGYWNGFFVPAGTPRSVIDFLYPQMLEVVNDKEVVHMAEQGGAVLRMPPREVDEFVRKDMDRWDGLLKAAGIEPT
ncbi:Bug family tripartite tricarboxylate transporter substrate binding protein [Ottowia thiooxydans]|uniref:Bug family tripartite tricarboxylate transporter substrate binding protein n=1 Tax=Ottowia thiooxydans TaxID=219182 RepID=UPI00040F966A|nr:tripartite tricarboxylate transporter substrate binding protein [Ottowia thiooxydans]